MLNCEDLDFLLENVIVAASKNLYFSMKQEVRPTSNLTYSGCGMFYTVINSSVTEFQTVNIIFGPNHFETFVIIHCEYLDYSLKVVSMGARQS